MNLMILGASGLVGSKVLEQALIDPRIEGIIAPTRSPLPVHSKLRNPVAQTLDSLLPEVSDWPITAVICAVGTTIKKAGSKEAFRHVDFELPLAFAQLSHQRGVEIFALVSAIGASSSSRFFFARVKGDLERDLASVGFRSLTIVRPSIIGGQRNEHRTGESIVLDLARFLRPILPRGFQVNPAPRIAEVLIESVLTGATGDHMVYSQQLI
jgi:uncharacterized protein YbjT (DUF2867 family)